MVIDVVRVNLVLIIRMDIGLRLWALYFVHI
jgi:hypothetical protein